MTREEAIGLIKDHIDTYVVCHGEEDAVAVSIDNVDVEAFDMAIKALEQQELCNNHEKKPHSLLDAYFQMRSCEEQEPKYCDRNICIQNEYNGIGCDECEVTKSQESKTDYIAHGTDGNFYKLTISNGKEFKQDPSGDAISRKDSISKIKELFSLGDCYCDEHSIVGTLNEMSSVNPQEPKTGHWIQTNESFINQDGQFIYNFICSECKSLSYFRKSNKKAIGANVCPNCGCRMESEEI